METGGKSLTDAAKEYIRNGLSVVPVYLDTKTPIMKWEPFQTCPMTIAEAEKTFTSLNGIHGIALVCGKVSGGLEAIDFDNTAGNIDETFYQFLKFPEVKSIIDNHHIPYEASPSGGFHLYFRCSTIQGSQKLARHKVTKDGKNEVVTIIETRGEGACCLCFPSKKYNLLNGSISAIPTISPDERDIFIRYARSFDECFEGEPGDVLKGLSQDDNKPGTDYNRDPNSIQESRNLLLQAGWVECGRTKSNTLYRRPGKKSGVSATDNGDVFYVFSTNASPFEPNHGYSPFAILALLKYGKNFSAAARELYQRGYGGGSRIQVGCPNLQEFFIATKINSNERVSLSIKPSVFFEMLRKAGFRKYDLGANERYLRIQNQIVEEVSLSDIVDFVKDSIPEPSMFDYFVTQEAKLLTHSKMRYLDKLVDDFNHDTSTSTWFYFSNVAIRISKGKNVFEEFAYDQLPRPVWRTQINKRALDIQHINMAGSEIESVYDRVSDCDENRKQRLMSATGYLLNGVREEGCAPAVIFSDEKIPDYDGDANGGTGKGVISTFIKDYRCAVTIDGKSSNVDSQFYFQEVANDTKLVVCDDVKKHYPFDYLFGQIANGFKVEKKFQSPFTIPFAQAPKLLITTNYSIGGTGFSYDRRKYEIEFSQHYNASVTPRKEFGHDLFGGWTNDEWAKADAFAFRCAQLFLDQGLIPDGRTVSNSKIRQAIDATSPEFVDFLKDVFDGNYGPTDREFERKDLWEHAKESLGDQVIQYQTFTKRLKECLKILNVKASHSRRHGKDYTRFLGIPKESIIQYREALSG